MAAVLTMAGCRIRQGIADPLVHVVGRLTQIMLAIVSTRQDLLHKPFGDFARGPLIELPGPDHLSKIARIPIRTLASLCWTGFGSRSSRVGRNDKMMPALPRENTAGRRDQAVRGTKDEHPYAQRAVPRAPAPHSGLPRPTRPGRVDLAAELPLPDADARRALLRLYQGSLVLDRVDLNEVVERTDGSTAPFLRELLRKAALLAAEADLAASAAGTGEAGSPDGAIRVTGAQLTAALDQLLDSRAQLTRVLPGGQAK